MMSESQADLQGRGKQSILPPTWFFAAIVMMVGLHFAFPRMRWLHWPWLLTGLAPLIAGFALAILADRQFKEAGTTVIPFEESSELVTGGMFRISRHPMYLGMAMALVGVALLLGSVTPWAGVVLFAVAMDRLFIAREEAMMREQYGEAYGAYAKRVRRWI